MPKLEIEGVGTFDIPADKRLVLAIEDSGVDIMHRCGGNAHCTTCRIEYLEGEPEEMTQAEQLALETRDLMGEARLSCQALCDHDMKVRVLMTADSSENDDQGGRPDEKITPPPMWVEKPA